MYIELARRASSKLDLAIGSGGVEPCQQQFERHRRIGYAREDQKLANAHDQTVRMEAREGFEPSHSGFADRRVATSPPRPEICAPAAALSRPPSMAATISADGR